MFVGRRIGLVLLALGLLLIMLGSVVAGSEGSVGGAGDTGGAATAGHQVGWALCLIGILASIIGTVAFANARRPFF